jgi:DNA-directed RNA polymerase specialized sigma24 family protein/ribosome-associated translation inhibitor RaiA
MNLHFSFKSAKTPDTEREIQQHVRKLERLLHVFRPDLIHLHGAMDERHQEVFTASLNLRLPTGQLFAAHDGISSTAALKSAFGDLLQQLKKHKELLRSEHKWARSKRSPGEIAPEVALEPAFAIEPPPRRKPNGEASHEEITIATFSEGSRNLFQADVRSYINANLPKLERFIDREIRFRESSGVLEPGQFSREEILDEVVMRALSADERPANISLERWMYKLAIRTLQQLAYVDGDQGVALRLEESVGKQYVSGTDDALLQYHQPGETMHGEDIVPDLRAGNPEEIAANDELIDQLESALRGARPEDREAFILFAIEGFNVAEITQITERDDSQVRESITCAREHLSKKLPPSNSLKRKLLQRTHIA